MLDYDMRAVIADLQQQVLDDASLNAALGYVLDPRLPSPEVFERPNWKTYLCTHGAVQWEQGYAVRDPFWKPWEAILDVTAPVYGCESIRPYEWHEVVCADGITRTFGIGFSERTRTWFVFHYTPGLAAWGG